MPDPRAAVPAVSAVLERLGPDTRLAPQPLTEVVRSVVDELRTEVAGGEHDASEGLLDRTVERVRGRIEALLAPPTRAINATGVVLHTGLGRAPLSTAAVEALVAAAGAHAVEVDERGRRGHRDRRLAGLLTLLTGAQDATFANNGAGALVLALRAVADGGRVAVSRGELIEIGGAFRLPDVVVAAGVELVEIGTTNRTHGDDVSAAVRDGVDAVLVVHPSNYRVAGFTTSPSLSEVVERAGAGGVPVIHDVGSGMVAASSRPELADEPPIRDSVAAGADLVTGSGDKLLGGPQAGLLVGRHDLVARARRDPLARALRLDKLRVAALVATLQAHLAPGADATADLPVHRMLTTDVARLRTRADDVVAALADRDVVAEVVTSTAVVGGGSVPGSELASVAVAVPVDAALRLRAGDLPVLGRVTEDRCLLDLRTVHPDDDLLLADAVTAALSDRA